MTMHRIDVHHHHFPPDYVEAVRQRFIERASEFSRVLEWTPAAALEAMDGNGIAKAYLSIAAQNVWFGDAKESRRLSRLCNDYATQLSRDHPGRFGVFAALPLPDKEGSLEEIRYAFDVLGADGVGLVTSYDGVYPGDKRFAPVFDELNRRKAVVFVHPTSCAACRNLVPEVTPAMMEYPVDTTRAIGSLLYSGTFARCPDIRFIFCHGGGVLPMLAHRIANQVNVRPQLKPTVPNGVFHELKKLYYEVNNAANPPGFSALRNLVPMSQILFGSDNPYVKPAHTIEGLQSLGLDPRDLLAIERDNALALFQK